MIEVRGPPIVARDLEVTRPPVMQRQLERRGQHPARWRGRQRACEAARAAAVDRGDAVNQTGYDWKGDTWYAVVGSLVN